MKDQVVLTSEALQGISNAIQPYLNAGWTLTYTAAHSGVLVSEKVPAQLQWKYIAVVERDKPTT